VAVSLQWHSTPTFHRSERYQYCGSITISTVAVSLSVLWQYHDQYCGSITLLTFHRAERYQYYGSITLLTFHRAERYQYCGSITLLTFHRAERIVALL
jgi:hypothetical protein